MAKSANRLVGLRNPAVVAAFSGWNDAGDAASGVIDHLVSIYEAQVVFTLDPEKFYDFQVSRPTTRLVDGDRVIEWPTTEVWLVRLAERDLVLVTGPEPNLRWRSYVTKLVQVLEPVEPELVVLLGALLTDSPHTRPVQVSATAGTTQVANQLGLELSTYGGPTGILGVLASELSGLGLPVVSMWASVPHYVSEPPCPKATLAMLAHLEDVLNLALDPGDLPAAGERWVNQVNELIADDPDIANYIAALEERRDESTPAPTGESIAAEFERYLRRRDRRLR